MNLRDAKRFKKSAESTSSAAYNSSLSTMDDDLWGDIDDDTLIQMTQMAECGSQEEDRSLLGDASFVALNDTEDWTLEKEKESDRFNGMQTQFPEYKPSEFKKPVAKPEPFIGGTDRASDPKNLVEECRNLKTENEKLSEEIYAKRGEVSLLRADLRKQNADLERERIERNEMLEKKKAEFCKEKEEFRKTVETVTSDRDFLQHQLQRAEERLKRMQAGSSCEKRVEKRNSLNNFPENLDISLMVPDPKRQSPPQKRNRVCKNSEMQTVKKSKRSCALKMNPHYAKGTLDASHALIFIERLSGLDLSTENSFLSSKILRGEDWKIVALEVMEQLSNSDDMSKVFSKIKLVLEIADISDVLISNEMVQRILEFCKKNVKNNYSFLTGLLPLLKLLIERKMLNASSFTPFLSILNNCLEYVDNLDIMVSLLDFLSGSTTNPEVAQTYCETSPNSCFIFKLCNSTVRVLSSLKYGNDYDEKERQLAGTFFKFLFLHLSITEDLTWIGSLRRRSACRACRMDILKTVAFLTVKLIQQTQRRTAKGENVAERLISCLRNSVFCLHQLWVTDTNFIQNLCDSPGSQRQYIWATKQLTKMESILKWNPEEAAMLTDLNVQYEDQV